MWLYFFIAWWVVGFYIEFEFLLSFQTENQESSTKIIIINQPTNHDPQTRKLSSFEPKIDVETTHEFNIIILGFCSPHQARHAIEEIKKFYEASQSRKLIMFLVRFLNKFIKYKYIYKT